MLYSQSDIADTSDEESEYVSASDDEKSCRQESTQPNKKPRLESRDEVIDLVDSPEATLLEPIPSSDGRIAALCTVCCSEPLDTVLLPCKHLCICQACANKISRCPLCRTPIGERMQILSCY